MDTFLALFNKSNPMKSNSFIETISQSWYKMLDKMKELAPELILAIMVFIIGLLIAWMLQRIVRKFLDYLDRKVNDKLNNRSIGVDLKSTSVLISKSIYWFVIVLTLALVTHILDFPVLTVWFNGLITYLPNILAGIIIVFVGIIVGKLVGDIVASASSKSGFVNANQLGNLIRYIFLIVSILIAIDQIGIDILLIVLILGIVLGALLFGAALAFGLGAQTAVSNILGSYYLQKTYKEGDMVQMDDMKGVIVKILPTSVIVETSSGQIMIPAKDFIEKKSILVKNQ
jgi:hypothetical protein